MQYIVHRRLKDAAICGGVNIPATTICEEICGVIYHNGLPVCYTTSENAHQFFARNDDESGLRRGKLTQAIQKTLSKRDGNYQSRWDKIWADPKCRQYKRTEYEDYWLWNHEFFNADIDVLLYIANLVGAKEDK
mgnify:FL=1